MSNKEQIAEQAQIDIEEINDPIEQLNIIHEAIKKIDTEFTEMSQAFKKEIYELSRVLSSLINGDVNTKNTDLYVLQYIGDPVKVGFSPKMTTSLGKKEEFIPYLLEIECLYWEFSNLLNDGELTKSDLVYENIESYRETREKYIEKLSEISEKKLFQIYPNPVHDKLNVVLDNTLIGPFNGYYKNTETEIVHSSEIGPGGEIITNATVELAGHDKPFNPLGGLQVIEDENSPLFDYKTANEIDKKIVTLFNSSLHIITVQSTISIDGMNDMNLQIDMSGLPSGVYYVRVPVDAKTIVSENGGNYVETNYATQKIIKI